MQKCVQFCACICVYVRVCVCVCVFVCVCMRVCVRERARKKERERFSKRVCAHMSRVYLFLFPCTYVCVWGHILSEVCFSFSSLHNVVILLGNGMRGAASDFKASNCNTLTHYNTLQHTATHCNTLQRTSTRFSRRHTATHCNTLQHTATHCNTLQHSATHCNTL